MKLKNVRVHRGLELEFQDGLVGIFGANGKGKSTILNSLHAGPTNDFKRFDCTREQCITFGEKSGFMEFDMSHGDVDFTIRRSLPSGNLLRIGNEEIGDAAKIQERLSAITGVEPGFLSRFVFKEQDGIYDFLSTTEADRRKAFHRLCGTERCEAAWEAFNKASERLKASVAAGAEPVAPLRAAKLALEKDLAGWRKKAEDAKAARLSTEERKRLDDVLASHAALSKLKATEDRLVEARDQAEKAYKAALAASQARKAELAAAVAERDALPSPTTDPQSALAVWRMVQEWDTKLKKNRESVETRQAAVAKLEEAANQAAMAVSANYAAKLAAFDKEIEEQHRIKDIAEPIANLVLSAEGCTECPLCRTPNVDLTEAVEDAKKRHDAAMAAIAAADRERRKIHRLVGERDAARTRLDAATALLQADKDRLAEMPERPEQPSVSVEELENIQAMSGRRDEAAETVAGAEAALSAAGRKEAAAGATRDAATAAVESHRRELVDAKKAATGDPAAIRDVLAKDVAAAEAVSEANGSIARLVKEIASQDLLINAARAKAAGNAKKSALSRIYADAAEAMHRSNLPSIVAKRMLDSLQGGVNEQLDRFGSPFSVAVSDDLSFNVTKPGEPPQSAKWLSTGQRVMLAYSFWASLVHKTGLLVLDEPTANLDPDNRRALADSFSALRAGLDGTLQIIVVTHAEELAAAVDQEIRI